jgi:hypothetical protein
MILRLLCIWLFFIHCLCADRLHMAIVIISTAIPYSFASCFIRFPFARTWIPFNSPRCYALSIVHDTSSKDAEFSFATTSFSWRHTNTCKNHGYNAVADDSGQVSSDTNWRHTNTHKNHGYNAVAEVSCAGGHVVPRILHSLPTKKVKHFWTIHTVRSLPDQGEDLCEVWFTLVQ